jgi:hypothetical protein
MRYIDRSTVFYGDCAGPNNAAVNSSENLGGLAAGFQLYGARGSQLGPTAGN